jgi:sigma-B regulation protein RsbU (phosphoserine phosphatase)
MGLRQGVFRIALVGVAVLRLDVPSGTLRYVDAGHGYCAVRRPSGELVRLPERSLPIGVRSDEVFHEGVVSLLPGDSLIVYSDGLVETDEHTSDLGDFERELAEAADADEMVGRLMERTPQRHSDDVTVVVLRRLPGPRMEAGSSARRAGDEVPAGALTGR